MSKTQNLIAIHSIQSYDSKTKQRVDIKPGERFTVDTAKEAGDLIAAGAARAPKAGDKGEPVETASTADGLPPAPAGYAPGTPVEGDVVRDPNAPAPVDTGVADPEVATGEAAKGESTTRGSRR